MRSDDDIAYSDRARRLLDDYRHHTLALNIYSPSTTDWRWQVSVSHYCRLWQFSTFIAPARYTLARLSNHRASSQYEHSICTTTSKAEKRQTINKKNTQAQSTENKTKKPTNRPLHARVFMTAQLKLP